MTSPIVRPVERLMRESVGTKKEEKVKVRATKAKAEVTKVIRPRKAITKAAKKLAKSAERRTTPQTNVSRGTKTARDHGSRLRAPRLKLVAQQAPVVPVW